MMSGGEVLVTSALCCGGIFAGGSGGYLVGEKLSTPEVAHFLIVTGLCAVAFWMYSQDSNELGVSLAGMALAWVLGGVAAHIADGRSGGNR